MGRIRKGNKARCLNFKTHAIRNVVSGQFQQGINRLAACQEGYNYSR